MITDAQRFQHLRKHYARPIVAMLYSRRELDWKRAFDEWVDGDICHKAAREAIQKAMQK